MKQQRNLVFVYYHIKTDDMRVVDTFGYTYHYYSILWFALGRCFLSEYYELFSNSTKYDQKLIGLPEIEKHDLIGWHKL